MKSTTRLAPLLLLLGIAAPWQGKSAQSSTQSSASQEAKTGKQQRARKKPELPVLPGDKAKDKPLPSASKTDSAIRRALEGASAAEISRKDLVQRFPKKNPLLGVWRVTKTFRNQANSAAITTGYVIFTKAYCSLHLFREAAFANSKAFQSSMRSYRIEGNQLIFSSLVGVRSGASREQILVEARGLAEKRRFLFQGPRILRIYQGTEAWLEMIKVEELE